MIGQKTFDVFDNKGKKMKIAILCTTFYISEGGTRIVEQQAKNLTEKGNEVTIFTLKTNIAPPQNVKLQILGMPDGFLAERVYWLLFPLDFIKAFKWTPKLKGFDVIYSHQYPLHWLAYLAKRFYGVRYIYYNYDLITYQAYITFWERTYIRLWQVLSRWLIKKADSAISISQYSLQMLKDETGLEGKVIYPEIDRRKFRVGIDGLRIRRKHNLGDTPIVLFVGRVSPTKGTHLLIDVFKLVVQQFADAKLLIVGSHFYSAYFKRLKRMSDDSVIFTGIVPDDELPYYYAACDVYATASLWEGFNLPLAEAQACGKPVVAFNIGPHPEVVKDKKSGILVPLGDINSMAEAIIHFLKMVRQ